jgi:hypothetical protein
MRRYAANVKTRVRLEHRAHKGEAGELGKSARPAARGSRGYVAGVKASERKYLSFAPLK